MRQIKDNKHIHVSISLSLGAWSQGPPGRLLPEIGTSAATPSLRHFNSL